MEKKMEMEITTRLVRGRPAHEIQNTTEDRTGTIRL